MQGAAPVAGAEDQRSREHVGGAPASAVRPGTRTGAGLTAGGLAPQRHERGIHLVWAGPGAGTGSHAARRRLCGTTGTTGTTAASVTLAVEDL
jgi:hypothetical protein